MDGPVLLVPQAVGRDRTELHERLEQQPEKAEPVKQVSDAENPAYVTLSTQIESAKNEVASLQRQPQVLTATLY